VAEQELDLFDITAVLAVELGAGTPQVMRPESLDSDLLGALFYDRPVAHALFDLAAFGNCPKQFAILDSRSSLPGVHAVLDPDRV